MVKEVPNYIVSPCHYLQSHYQNEAAFDEGSGRLLHLLCTNRTLYREGAGGGAGGQAHAKSRRNSTHGCQNRNVLGDRRGHTTRHRNGVVVPRRRIILAIQNQTTP